VHTGLKSLGLWLLIAREAAKMIFSLVQIWSRCSPYSWRDLEDDALIVGAADDGCAEDISLSVDCNAAVGQSSFFTADEVVEVGEIPAVGAGS